MLKFMTLTSLLAWSSSKSSMTGTQSYRVIGQLICGDSMAFGIRTRLIEYDFDGKEMEEMDASYTDADGRFDLFGEMVEMTTIEPYLEILHDCNNTDSPCQRRWLFQLPTQYITLGRYPRKTFDVGTWNLEIRHPNERYTCSPIEI